MTVKSLADFQSEVAQRHGLGKSLVIGHKVSYFNEATMLFANQAVEMCAESAEQINTAPMNSYEAHYEIDKQSILNVKDQLK